MSSEILEVPGMLKSLAEQIKIDIDAYCVATYNDGPRSHLGASQIGHPCSRYLYYQFRWIAHKVHDGRQYRLFQRGHFEEPRFTAYLEGIGCKITTLAKLLFYNAIYDSYSIENSDYVYNESTEKDVTHDHWHLKRAEEQGVKFDKGKAQIRISDCKGHFGGSLDAIVTLPERYGLLDVVFLGEYKTQGTGRKFDELKKEGCMLKKYQHFCQQCTYGYKLGLKYGIYMVVDKNNDDLHIEVVKLDDVLGTKMIAKAESIIFTQEAPPKVSKSASYYECNYCDTRDVCWNNAPALVNCRSCFNASAVEEGNWYCKEHQSIIPKEYIHAACDKWVSLI